MLANYSVFSCWYRRRPPEFEHLMPPPPRIAAAIAALPATRSHFGLSSIRAMSSFPPLPLTPPTAQSEHNAFKKRVASLTEFFSQPRFKGIKRPYTATDIATKQGSLPVVPPTSSMLADKLFALLTKAEEEKKPAHTMGAIDPIQMTQMAKHQNVLYVSGWASSSVLTTANNEVGPDLA
jgi:isocitrate lyase